MGPMIFDTPFGFGIDITFWMDIFSLPTYELIEAVFAIFGWVILVLLLFFMGAELWLLTRRRRYMYKWQNVVLAVDIPPLFIQTPKAVEQIFAHLSGAHITPNIGQKYWMGKKQKFFSFEIISIEGYIQFIIRTEAEFRDLVEAAVYAQYPEAEITEVEDYVDNVPRKYPDSEHDLFGVEFKLAEANAYPIRTYPSFEYSLSKDVVFSDPMAALLENFSRIGQGENLWYQIIVEPTGNDWKIKGIELVKKIIANKKEKTTFIAGTFLSDILTALMHELQNIWFWTFEPRESTIKETPPGKVVDLSPGMKNTVEAIEEKISKIGFKTKIRILYAARKDVFNPSRSVDGFIGSMNQFHIIGRNAIVPYKTTLAFYAFKKMLASWKKIKFARAFRWRLLKSGGNPFILNIEELATIWHFPLPFVKTPLMQKASAKRGEPPMGLPVEFTEGPLRKVLSRPGEAKEIESPPPPSPPPPPSLQYG